MFKMTPQSVIKKVLVFTPELVRRFHIQHLQHIPHVLVHLACKTWSEFIRQSFCSVVVQPRIHSSSPIISAKDSATFPAYFFLSSSDRLDVLAFRSFSFASKSSMEVSTELPLDAPARLLDESFPNTLAIESAQESARASVSLKVINNNNEKWSKLELNKKNSRNLLGFSFGTFRFSFGGCSALCFAFRGIGSSRRCPFLPLHARPRIC